MKSSRAGLLYSLWVVSCGLEHADAATSEDSISSRRVHETSLELQSSLDGARVSHVRTILSNRLHAVLTGYRARQFKQWAAKQGDLKVISMHGVDESDLDCFSAIGTVASSDGLFPDDAINLSMVAGGGVSSHYAGEQGQLIESDDVSLIDLFFRSIHLSFNFLPVLATGWIAFLSSSFRSAIWFNWVAACLASSGPAFIKWGQWASTRTDMFPESLCTALAQLHSDAPTHSWKYTEKVMEVSLGLPKGSLLQVFDSFDEKPLASGSIAQVHKATLNGTTVVAKVRHPRVAKLINMDFRLMRLAALISDWLPSLSWLHIRDSVEQFSHTMAAQAHLNVEGHHLEVLNYNFRNWNHVKFPRPLYATSAAILETFESGQIVTHILDDYDTIAAQAALGDGTFSVEEVDDTVGIPTSGGLGYQILPMDVAKFIVTTGLSLYLKMLLVDKQMHADLHPGNIMLDLAGIPNLPSLTASGEVVRSGTSTNKKNTFGITLVDAGMVAQLSESESTNFIGLLCSLGEGDGKIAAKCALRFSSDSELTRDEENAFVEAMHRLFKEKCRGYHTGTDVGAVLRGVLGLIRQHKVRIDANYATLIVNCLCVESLGRRVCPSYNVLDGAQSLLQAYQGLCYDKRDGSPNINPSKLQKGLFRLKMPFAYFKKSLFDDTFFTSQSSRKQKANRV